MKKERAGMLKWHSDGRLSKLSAIACCIFLQTACASVDLLQHSDAVREFTPRPGYGRIVAYLHNEVYGSIDVCKFNILVNNTIIGSVSGKHSIMIDLPPGTYRIGATYDMTETYCPRIPLDPVFTTTVSGTTSYVVVSDAPLRKARLELADPADGFGIASQHARTLADASQVGLIFGALMPQTVNSALPPQGNATAQARLDQPPSVKQVPSEHGTSVALPSTAPTAPAISAISPVQTTGETVGISGKVTAGGRLTSLKVDGSPASFNSDGSFSFRRAVPPGDSDIRLVATNEWGQSAATTVTVTRTIAAGTEVAFNPLDPSRHRAQVRPNAIALIIGIERYKSVPPAEFAENDARSFYDYATNALGVPASRVKLLTGADATRVDVEAAILTWLKPQVVRDQTEVFIFFSGHGLASDDGKDLYLFPQDGNRALLERSALRRRELIDMIVESGAKSATLFLDTCYSGGTRGKDMLIASARPILVAAKEQSIPPNVTIFAAGGNDQLSSTLAQAKHGLFSYFLMKGLEGDAAGADHTITAAKLEGYLADHVPSEAAKLGRTQTPQLFGDASRVISSW